MCLDCRVMFVSQSKIKIHYKYKHEGFKYPCTQCDKNFAKRCHLTKHIKCQHEGVKYPCTKLLRYRLRVRTFLWVAQCLQTTYIICLIALGGDYNLSCIVNTRAWHTPDWYYSIFELTTIRHRDWIAAPGQQAEADWKDDLVSGTKRFWIIHCCWHVWSVTGRDICYCCKLSLWLEIWLEII